MRKLLFLIPATGLLAWGAISDPVKIDTGLLSGTVSGDLKIYKGIPFASPPTSELRWKPPLPATKWDGVRKAEQFGKRCMQGQPTAQDISEDCLTLNIWTPAKAASDKLPVALWVYGGGFNTGSGSTPGYDGAGLATQGLVMVTFNYRLGAFGFLAHPDLSKESGHKGSGNYGMMDTVAALKWIQRNIAAFGGDPSKVTVMGESAGAIMVAALVGSPEGKGLFVRAVSQSGAWMGLAASKMGSLQQAEEAGAKFAASIGANTLVEMRAKPAAEIMANRGSGLVVDGWMIPEDQTAVFAKGKQNDVDVLIGSNKDEGTFFARGITKAQDWTTQAKQKYADQADTFLKLYPGDSDAQATASQLENSRDQVAWHMRLWAQLTAKKGRKAYLYYFTHEPPVAAGQPSRGATHTAELSYMFNNLTPGRPWVDADRTLAEQMVSYWANFIISGNPNGKGLPQWNAFGDKSPKPMVLGETVEPAPDAVRISLYDGFLAKQELARK